MKKRLICLILLAATLLTMCQPVFAAGIGREPAPVFKSDLKDTLRAEKIALLTESLIRSEDAKIRISAIRRLQDFAGNEYTLIECEPTGYYILHNASGRYAEYSSETVSPYRDVSGDLYYGGPTYYFEANGASYTDVIEKTTLALEAAEQRQELVKYCGELNESLMGVKQTDVTTYLWDDTVSVNGSAFANLSFGGEEDIQATSDVTTYAYCPNFFMNTTGAAVGYYAEGKKGFCGYVAANLILRYWHYRGKIKLPSYFTSTYAINTKALTKELIAIGKQKGYGNGLVACQVKEIIKAFCNKYRLSLHAGYDLLSIGVKKQIVTYRRPVIIGGYFPGAGGPHYVIAYGFRQKRAPGIYWDFYICHYGWTYEGYEKVNVNVAAITIGDNVKCYP